MTKIRAILLAAAALAIGSFSTARAQELSPAPPGPSSVAPAPTCAEIQERPVADQRTLEAAKLCRELEKLKQETRQLSASNRQRDTPVGDFLSLVNLGSAVIGSLVTLLLGGVGIAFSQTLQRTENSKLEQAKRIERERQNLELMKALGTARNRPLQLAAASAILRRIEEIDKASRSVLSRKHSASEFAAELATLCDVLSAVLRYPKIDASVSKYMADEMVKVLRTRYRTKEGAPRVDPEIIAMKRFDWSNAKLKSVNWQCVDLSGAELFEADFEGATLRWAKFTGAICYATKFRGASLRDADFTDCNCFAADFGGADLRGADLDAAKALDQAKFFPLPTTDERTVWPGGFRLPSEQAG